MAHGGEMIKQLTERVGLPPTITATAFAAPANTWLSRKASGYGRITGTGPIGQIRVSGLPTTHQDPINVEQLNPDDDSKTLGRFSFLIVEKSVARILNSPS